MRKLVRIPPMLDIIADSLGNPFFNMPTSVVVPPISATMALLRPDKNAAPRMLLVGPEEKVKNRKLGQSIDLHQGAIVLRDVKGRRYAYIPERRLKRRYR